MDFLITILYSLQPASLIPSDCVLCHSLLQIKSLSNFIMACWSIWRAGFRLQFVLNQFNQFLFQNRTILSLKNKSMLLLVVPSYYKLVVAAFNLLSIAAGRCPLIYFPCCCRQLSANFLKDSRSLVHVKRFPISSMYCKSAPSSASWYNSWGIRDGIFTSVYNFTAP